MDPVYCRSGLPGYGLVGISVELRIRNNLQAFPFLFPKAVFACGSGPDPIGLERFQTLYLIPQGLAVVRAGPFRDQGRG